VGFLGREESSFSEEKEAKRLFIRSLVEGKLLDGQKFFGSFFQKRTAFLLKH
jgi:hypothetical protein